MLSFTMSPVITSFLSPFSDGISNITSISIFSTIARSPLAPVFRFIAISAIPSTSEGAGLPVLEAMACGVPVACAKSGALPEIAGSHALFFNPDDLNETADAIEKIISDKDLRKKLLSGGIEWTKRFSWEKTALRTLEVLSNATSG